MYIKYLISTGEILGCFDAPSSDIVRNTGEGESAIMYEASVSENLFYVIHTTGTLTPRVDYPLSDLPLPCRATIEGVEYHCTEQPTFQFDSPGTYVIQVDAGPKYLKKEFTIDYQSPEPLEA